MKDNLLTVRDLSKHFRLRNGTVLKAVNGVSFAIPKGETLGLIGESGCGKSTCGRVCLGLYPKTGGQVLFDGMDVHALDQKQRSVFTGKAQMIFQDPHAAFNPRLPVRELLLEGAVAHGRVAGKRAQQELAQLLLQQVGLEKEDGTRYIHEFSGGQCQRIGIARALALNPTFMVCDEPISALDISIQAQIVNLLIRLQAERGLTYLFIAHDLAMVRHVSTRVAVMYLGNLVEYADTEELYSHPLHPYTKALWSSAPIPDPDAEQSRPRFILNGDIPNPVDLPAGCCFQNRCSQRHSACADSAPVLREVSPKHFAACLLYA